MTDTQGRYAKTIAELTSVVNSLREEVKHNITKAEHLPNTGELNHVRQENKIQPETLSLYEERTMKLHNNLSEGDEMSLKKSQSGSKEFSNFWWLRKMSFDKNIGLSWSSMEIFKEKAEVIGSKLDQCLSQL
jgi:archaellum component FlaC